MSQIHKVTFNPNPMQKRFIESRAKADLFCSRMGEGKTVALAWSALSHTRHNPGANWCLIRDTWENMQATTLKTFLEWFPPGIFGTFNQTRRLFTWASGIADGTVEFLGMDDPADASKLMSRELSGFGIDEPAPATASGGVDEMIFDIAMSRLRKSGMKWYCAKLAENNPDETHWTYRRFVTPGTEGFKLWQPDVPENEENLPPQYYAELRRIWRHRPDLVRRFIAGEFGFQQEGKAVTPQWNDRLHLASGLRPMPGRELVLTWDFGHNPTCIITQVTPIGHWLILHSMVGDGIGVEELIHERVKPLLTSEYRKHKYWHTGDPQGKQREQTSIHRSAVKFLRAELGGRWRPGPVRLHQRVEPLRAVLSRLVGGVGMLQVDRVNAKEVHQALRGGWHFRVARTGVVSGEPVKNIHCVDEETEILTTEGFRRWNTVSSGAECYGYDLQTGGLVPAKVEAVHVFDKGPFDVLKFEGRALSMCLTPNHQAIIQHGRFDTGTGVEWGQRSYTPASDLNSTYAVPGIFVKEGRRWRVFSNNFVRLCAWVMTEGYYRKDGSNEIWITQSEKAHPEYCKQLRVLMQEFGGLERDKGSGGRSFVLSGDIAWMVREVLPGKVPSTRFVQEMRRSERLLFLYEAVKGDGSHSAGTLPVHPGNMNYENFWPKFKKCSLALCCSCQDEADVVQFIAILAGVDCRVCLPDHNHSYWTVRFKRRRKHTYISNLEKSEEQVSLVWCPQTTSGNFIARRHGIVFPTKNSHPADALSYAAAVLFPVGKPRLMRKGAPPPEVGMPDYSEDVGGGSHTPTGPLQFERPNVIIPTHGSKLGG